MKVNEGRLVFFYLAKTDKDFFRLLVWFSYVLFLNLQHAQDLLRFRCRLAYRVAEDFFRLDPK